MTNEWPEEEFNEEWDRAEYEAEMEAEWGDEEEEEEWDEEFASGSCPESPKLFKHPGKLVLKKRDPDAEIPDVSDLEPQDVNPLDVESEFNPFNYCYNIPIERLNMEVVVQFHIETLNFDRHKMDPINFQGKELPFFPTRKDGVDPAVNQQPGEVYRFYNDGEFEYQMCPAIVRATVKGDEKNTKDELVTREFVKEYVTPEILQDAIEDWYDKIRGQEGVPEPILVMLRDFVGHDWRPGDDEYDY